MSVQSRSILVVRKRAVRFQCLFNRSVRSWFLFHFTGPVRSVILRTVQSSKSHRLRLLTGTSWYISNDFVYKDVNLSTINDFVKVYYKRIHNIIHNLHTYQNLHIKNMFSFSHSSNVQRSLK